MGIFLSYFELATGCLNAADEDSLFLFTGISLETMSLLLLPAVYASAMVAFTGMRKIRMEKYLKGHQVSIAVAVGLSIVIPALTFLGKLDMDVGKMYALVLFLQAPKPAKV